VSPINYVNYSAASSEALSLTRRVETIGEFTFALAEIFTAATVSAGAEYPQDTQEKRL